jgi:hypothetical protein
MLLERLWLLTSIALPISSDGERKWPDMRTDATPAAACTLRALIDSFSAPPKS